jgi:hypothetical protein
MRSEYRFLTEQSEVTFQPYVRKLCVCACARARACVRSWLGIETIKRPLWTGVIFLDTQQLLASQTSNYHLVLHFFLFQIDGVNPDIRTPSPKQNIQGVLSLHLNSRRCFMLLLVAFSLYILHGGWFCGGVVVKALCYKPEGRGIDIS